MMLMVCDCEAERDGDDRYRGCNEMRRVRVWGWCSLTHVRRSSMWTALVQPSGCLPPNLTTLPCPAWTKEKDEHGGGVWLVSCWLHIAEQFDCGSHERGNGDMLKGCNGFIALATTTHLCVVAFPQCADISQLLYMCRNQHIQMN